MTTRQLQAIFLANASRLWRSIDPRTTRIVGFSGQDGAVNTHYYILSPNNLTKEAEAVQLVMCDIRMPPDDVLPIRMGYSAREDVLVVEDLESVMRVLAFLLGIPEDQS